MSSTTPNIGAGPIFAATSLLPKGPHGLTREQVAESQRTRLMAAMTVLLAERGYAAVTIGELASRAGVSRGAFYANFASKEDCLLAAYTHFATTLLTKMIGELAEDTAWEEFVDRALDGYLRTLERDPVAARAFILEMDAAGETARQRRRDEVHAIASVLAQRYATARERDPALGPLPETVFVGLTLGVRELVREALQDEPSPRLTELVPDLTVWIGATIRGAASA
jgi:AcrR family transcriptional regulator